MNAAISPDPWSANLARLSDNSMVAVHVVDANMASVAQLSIHDEATTEANARVMAAAPELLTACADWIDWLKQDSPWREDAADYEAQMLAAMRAAIAKARGEE